VTALLTPAQAANVLHNLRRLKAGFGITSFEGFCADLVGAEAAPRLVVIINRLADGMDEHVTLVNEDYPPNLGLLQHLLIVGVSVIGHQKVTFYSIQREKLFEQIGLLWKVPCEWAEQLMVRRWIVKQAYNQYLRDPHWKLTREAVLRRDKACTRCGTTENLQVHHKTYAHVGNEPLEDLITLCKGCHNLEHKRALWNQGAMWHG